MTWYVIKYVLSCHEYHAVLQLSYRCTRLGALSALRLWKMVRGARHWKSRPRQRTAPSPLSMTSWAWDSEMKRMTCVPCADMKTSPISYALIYLFTYSTLYTVYSILSNCMKVQFKSTISRNQITTHQYISEVSSMRRVCACSKGRTCWHAASRIWFKDSSIEVPWLYVSLGESRRVWVRSWKCEKKTSNSNFNSCRGHLAISCQLQWLWILQGIWHVFSELQCGHASIHHFEVWCWLWLELEIADKIKANQNLHQIWTRQDLCSCAKWLLQPRNMFTRNLLRWPLEARFFDKFFFQDEQKQKHMQYI